MTLKKSHFILIAIVVAALAFLVFKLNQTKPATEQAVTDNSAPPKAALTVDLVKATRSTIKQTISANGSISPWQEAVIGSESSGLMLTQVLVNVGDSVRRGRLLAQFSAATITADIAQAQANLAEAKANALTDPMTGLLNKRSLEVEFGPAGGEAEPLFGPLLAAPMSSCLKRVKVKSPWPDFFRAALPRTPLGRGRIVEV